MASMFVFCVPLNKLDPNLPGYIENSATVSTLTCTTKGAGFPSFENMTEKNRAEGHSGTTKVPWALHLWACWITCTQGHSQLLSSHQLSVNASIASELPTWRIRTTFWLSVNQCTLSLNSMDISDSRTCLTALISRHVKPQALGYMAAMLHCKACIVSLTWISVDNSKSRRLHPNILAIKLCYCCKPKMYFQYHLICNW